jgi:hypothetical protein
MLDVHAPRAAAHTWRDFFIHIATITVGLLIAVGLEQTVEWFHHRHQRKELETQLLEEARHNFEGNQENFAASDAELQWLLSVQADVQSMLVGRPRLKYRFRPESSPGVPVNWTLYETGVWDAAKASGTIELLTPDVAQKYTVLYGVGTLAHEYRLRFYEALTRQLAYESKFVSTSCPNTPDLQRMKPQQLEEYSTLIGQTFAAGRMAKNRLRIFAFNVSELLNHLPAETSLERKNDALRTHPDQFQPPAPAIVATEPPTQPDCQ